MSYIQCLNVILLDEPHQPFNAVQCDNGSPDLNKDMGGKYAYLEKVFTDDKSKAARAFEVQISEKRPANADKYVNYAEGAKGGYRYILSKHKGGAEDEEMRVVDVKLFRSSTTFPEVFARIAGYEVFGDLNMNRGGDYLNLGVKYAT